MLLGSQRENDEPLRPTSILTVQEAARALRISEQKLRGLIHDGSLKAYRVGIEIRILERDLFDFLESNPVTGPVPQRDGRRRGRRPGPQPKETQ